jgi:tetratricopeptide (TPR) repeat protein
LPPEPATRQIFPGLRTACTIDSTGDVEAALAVIGDGLGWRIARGVEAIQTADRRLHRGSCVGIDYSVDVTGWELVDEAFQGGGPCYGVREHRLLWNLQCGEEYDPKIYDARRRWTEHSRDDRLYYELMCDYADSYLQSSGEQVGAHLFFLEDTTHLAVSYRAGPHWKRRYSIMLVEPHSYKIAEFLFTFQFEGDFAEYCRLAPIMDALVASLRWGARDTAVPTPAATPSQAADRVERVLDDVAPANKLLDEGMALMKAGELARGLATLERVLDYTNSAAMQGAVHFNIGLAHERSRDWGAAVRSYQAALAANSVQPNALCNLGSIHHRRGDVQSALECFLQAAEIDPTDRIAANNIVICYQDLGETEKAREWLARWRSLQP